MLFVEFPNFTKRITELLNDEEYRRLQAALIANPELGDLIRGTGGLRKARWSAQCFTWRRNRRWASLPMAAPTCTRSA